MPLPYSPLHCGQRAGVGNRSRPLWLLQTDPQAGRARARASGGGVGPAGWVSEGAAGNERGKSRCRRFPRARRAGRPPSAGAAAAAASHAARLGARGSGIWVTGPSLTLGTLSWLPPEGPTPPHYSLPFASLAKGWMFARSPEATITGKRLSSRGLFLPRLTQILPGPTARPLKGFLLQGSFWHGGNSMGCIEDHSFGQHRGGPIPAQVGLDRSARPHPPDEQLPWGGTISTDNLRQRDSLAISNGRCHTS